MNAERWHRIEETCQAALNCQEDERTALLDRLCAGDPELRSEVEGLLREQDRAETLLDVPAWEAAAVDFADDVQEAPTHLKPGQQLGPFVIERRAGAGGMGEVYRARDTRLDRTVALKVLPPEAAADAESRAQLQLEARAVSALAHPHICALFDIRCDDGVDYLVMEYLEGRTLAERMQVASVLDGERRPLPLADALAYAAEIADALAAAHRRGIIHCDLKPSNVMLTKEGVKLLDFGVSRIRRAPLVSVTSGLGEPISEVALLGTVNYMAPEHFAGAEPDARSDLFGFGALLFEMLTGRRAFEGPNAAAVVRAILDDEPQLVSTLQPAAPPALDDLVRRCLEKDPDERWDSARLAADELRAIAELSAQPRVESPAAPVTATRPGPPSHRLRWWGAATLVLFASVALFLASPWSRERVEQPLPLQRFAMDLGPQYRPHPRVGFAMLSPDGSRVLFRAAGVLHLRRLDQADSVALDGTRGALYPFFSPDGRWIAFFLGSSLYKVSIGGGPVIEICEASGMVRGASWGDDGRIVGAFDAGAGLSVLPSSGGAPTPLTWLDPARREVTHRWPQVLPGSRAVLFTAHTRGGRYDEASIEVQSLDTGERRTVHRGGYGGRYVASGHIVFVRNTTLYAVAFDVRRLEVKGRPFAVLDDVIGDPDIGRIEFSAADTGAVICLTGAWRPRQFSLEWHDRSGHSQLVSAVPGGYGDPRVSPRGDRVALSVSEATLARRQLAVLDLSRREPLKLPSEAVELTPAWAPDGEHLVFASDRDGAFHNLYWTRADATKPVVRLTTSGHIQAAGSFTPDGRRFAYTDVDPVTDQDIWTITLDLRDPDRPVPGKPEPLVRTPLDEGGPAFSPDGRWLAYEVTEGGTRDVYVQAATANAKTRWQVSRGGGTTPLWLKGRRELVYQGGNRQVMQVPYTVSGDQFVAGQPRPWPGLTLGSNYEGSHSMRNFDLSPDGQRLLILAPPNPPTPEPRATVTVFVNFLDELRRRAPGR